MTAKPKTEVSLFYFWHDDMRDSPFHRKQRQHVYQTMRRHIGDHGIMSWTLLATLSVILIAGCTLVVADAATTATTREGSSSEAVKVRLRNDGRVRIEVGWIDPSDEIIHPIGVMEPFGSFQIDSFLGHEFELLELASASAGSGRCDVLLKSTRAGDKGSSLQVHEGCVLNTFRVKKRKEQNLLVTDALQIRNDDTMDGVHSFEVVDPSEWLGRCRFEAKRRLLKGKNDGYPKDVTNGILEQYRDCLAQGVAPKLNEAKKEVKFEERVRLTVAAHMENFTCASEMTESTPDLEQRHWISEKDNVRRLVNVKFDRPSSQIHVVENFASMEECAAMEESVAGRLGLAATEDGKGGSEVSKNRKAMQAYIEPDWSKEAEGDPIIKLNRRIFDYTNHVLGLNITVDGQEPLMSIQYFGRGSSDIEPDRYTPHCDGKCEGDPLKHASRMATMVIYCEVPEDGRSGYTNFGNAGVTIKPQVGSGIFFSYIDPKNNITDRGYSRHSGCPVFEGTKKIITQWIRLGVNADTPYEAYNTLEVLLTEDGE